MKNSKVVELQTFHLKPRAQGSNPQSPSVRQERYCLEYATLHVELPQPHLDEQMKQEVYHYNETEAALADGLPTSTHTTNTRRQTESPVSTPRHGHAITFRL